MFIYLIIYKYVKKIYMSHIYDNILAIIYLDSFGEIIIFFILYTQNIIF